MNEDDLKRINTRVTAIRPTIANAELDARDIVDLVSEVGRLRAELAALTAPAACGHAGRYQNEGACVLCVINDAHRDINALDTALRENGAELAAARAEAARLRDIIVQHDTTLFDNCAKQKLNGDCANEGMCDSCPRQWTIDAALRGPAQSEQP